MFRLLISAILTLAPFCVKSLRGDEKPTFTADLLTEVDSLQFSRYFAMVDLGKVSPGPMKFRLVITNIQDKSVRIDAHKESCSCISVELLEKEADPGEKLVADIELEIPSKVPDPYAMQEIGFSNGGKENGKIRVFLNYQIQGVLSFKANSQIYRMPRGANPVATINVPIVLTSPVQSDNVSVKSSREDLLEVIGVHQSRNKDNNRIAHSVECKVKLAQLPDYGASLLLSAKDNAGDAGAELKVYLDPELPLKVSPSMLRLRESEGEFVATAMLTCKVAAKDAETRQFSVIASCGGKPVKVKTTRLSDNVCRLRLKIARDAVESLEVIPTSIKWEITASDIRTSTETSVKFPGLEDLR